MIVTKFLPTDQYSKFADWLCNQDTETQQCYFGTAASDHLITTLIERILSNPDNHYFLVALAHNQWVGTVHIAINNSVVEFGIIVDKNYRRQGIYNDYLTKIIQYAKEMGFSQIVSCFVAANNVIHQAKVKKEFYVSSFEIHPEYGNIIWLTHFLNDDLKKAFYFRSGMVEFSKKLFQNSEGNANNLLNKILKSSH